MYLRRNNCRIAHRAESSDSSLVQHQSPLPTTGRKVEGLGRMQSKKKIVIGSKVHIPRICLLLYQVGSRMKSSCGRLLLLAVLLRRGEHTPSMRVSNNLKHKKNENKHAVSLNAHKAAPRSMRSPDRIADCIEFMKRSAASEA